MNNELRKNGFTLVELMVVLAVITMLVAFALPAVRSLRLSCDSTGAESMISSALSNARAIAAKQQRYAGVRFQKIYDPNHDINDVPQYMIFVVYDMAATGYASGFRAVEGLKPVKLPDNIGVTDLLITGSTPVTDAVFNNIINITDTTTFSILFSPTGKLIINDVRVCRATTADEIFNNQASVTAANQVGMFIHDVHPALGLDQEPSRGSFVIYEKEKFKAAKLKLTDYLGKQQVIHINPYTGTIIEK